MIKKQRRNENASKAATFEAINLNQAKEKVMPNNTTLVPFYGSNLITAKVGEVVYVAMRPIVEAMGLNWGAQAKKLENSKLKHGCTDISTPTKSGIQDMLYIPIRKLNGWLFSINPAKVKESIRDTVIKYQEECFEVLHDYWTKGEAINPRLRKEKTRKALPNGLTIEQQDTIKAFHKELVGKVPKDKQASMAITLWSSIKAKYGVSYKEVPPEEFTSIVSLMSRVAVEKGVLHGELLDDDFTHPLFDEPKKKPLELNMQPFPESVFYDDFGEQALTYKSLVDLYGERYRGQVPIVSLLRQLESKGYDTRGCWMEYSGLRHLLRNTHQRLERVQDFLYMPVCAKVVSN
ncbi:phage antirepressor N-terminal domain-containing protein [Neisseriaceae bacterium CLB008]